MTMAWDEQRTRRGSCSRGLVGSACLSARPSRRRPASSRGVQCLFCGRVRRDSHHRHCSSSACAPSATLNGVPEVFWQTFHQATALLGVETSGASADAWALRLSLTEIQVRGRWKAAGSVRRYAKGGRVAHQMIACLEPLQRFAKPCVAALPDALVRVRPPLRPPALPHS